jgi:hypothetical protein
MGGSSTFGYELVNGKIHYCIYQDYALLEHILPAIQNGNIYPIREELNIAKSIEDYFSEKRYKEEDSKVRGVYKIDGTFMYKFWGDKGYFVYHLI